MRKHWSLFSVFLIFSAQYGLTLPAIGQTPVAVPASKVAKPVTEAEGFKILAHTLRLVDLPDGKVVPIKLKIAGIPGAPPSLKADLTLKGHARMVTHEGRKIGQVLVTAVADAKHDVRLQGAGLSSQVDLKQPVLEPADILELKGDWKTITAAAEALAERAVEPATEREQARADDRRDSDTPIGAGGGGPKNNQASAYETPERTARSTEAEPVVAARTTTEGCTVRVDLAQKVAIRQSRTIVTEDGTVTSEEGCSDSEQRFPLERSYAQCEDRVDLNALTATPQFKWYYVDAGGLPVMVSTSCEPDPETTFEIVEDHDACTVLTNFDAGRAVPQAALVYINRDNRRVEARDCAASVSKPAVEMTQTTSGCTRRHDFKRGVSVDLAMWTYVLEGAAYQATPCADTDTTYAHETVYKDAAGGWVCPQVLDRANQQVALQSRVMITVEGLPEFITGCTPDAAATSMVATTEGCEDPSTWTHSLSAGVSYGHERWYYMFEGDREYVTECIAGTTSFAHSVATTGYQYHDDQLFAYPLSTVSITTPSGAYNIKTSEVLQGASTLAYALASRGDEPTGATSYEGCNAYSDTALTEVYERPDGSEYRKIVGPGDRLGPRNACVVEVSNNWSRVTGGTVSHTRTNDQQCGRQWRQESIGEDSWEGWHYFQSYYASSEYEGTKTMRREDGEAVSTTTGRRTLSQCSKYCQQANGHPFQGTYSASNRCPVTMTTPAQITTWRGELGWW